MTSASSHKATVGSVAGTTIVVVDATILVQTERPAASTLAEQPLLLSVSSTKPSCQL
jgi:hypothetical protein